MFGSSPPATAQALLSKTPHNLGNSSQLWSTIKKLNCCRLKKWKKNLG